VPQLLPEMILRAAPGRLLVVQAFLSTPLAIALAIYAAGQAARNWTPGATAAWLGRAIPVVALIVVLAELSVAVYSRGDLMRQGAQRLLTNRGPGDGPVADEGSASFWRDAGMNGGSQVLTSRSASRPALVYGHLPVVLNAGSFDYIPYIPQTGGAIAKIVQDGYGISFSDPPPEMRHGGGLPPDGGRAYWARLAPADWCRVSRSLGVGALIVPSDWTVNLPRLVFDAGFTMYKIACD
jgi:hypothetical protein